MVWSHEDFHAYNYVRHFISACARILGLEGTPEGVKDQGKLTRVAAIQRGLNKHLIFQLVKSTSKNLRKRSEGRKGFSLGYTEWVFHGEPLTSSSSEAVQHAPSIIDCTNVQQDPACPENQPTSEREPSEDNPQEQEPTNVEDNDTLEIIDEQGNLKKKRGVTRAKDVWTLPSGQRIKNLSRIGKASRANHTTPHTIGSKSFARKRQEFEDLLGDLAKKASTFEFSNATKQIKESVFKDKKGEDRYGRVRGYGIGPTPTHIFGIQAHLRNVENENHDPMKKEVQRLQVQLQDMQNKHESEMNEIKSLLYRLVGQSVNSGAETSDSPSS
ncbi:Alpha,alpha-trehalose-phosphate synthase (UDP-forming) 1 [Ananas comosus]|uniref:Alpha,alpha-trehalose-phosphate synthase (UDP-forming) 1 n=1 Tax=Ananas comosus TaxID=4615 RepID=A0A199V8Y6_ANACO|nr:Alpha,alpha-trehalose-phosphate synthase (UDP-forming) 1 [Ananas comosus]